MNSIERDARIDGAQAREAAIIRAVKTDANRIAPSVWSGMVGNTLYYVHERYDGRQVWYTAHEGAPHGPRPSNTY